MHATPALPRRRVDLSGRPRPAGPWATRLALVACGFAVTLLALVLIEQPPPSPGATTPVRTAGLAAGPSVDLFAVASRAESTGGATDIGVMPPPSDAPPGVAPTGPDDLVPVVHLARGGTLWELARARVGRDVRAIFLWIGEVQLLNDLSDPDRVEPGPLIVPSPDPGRPLYMRRADLPAQP